MKIKPLLKTYVWHMANFVCKTEAFNDIGGIEV